MSSKKDRTGSSGNKKKNRTAGAALKRAVLLTFLLGMVCFPVAGPAWAEEPEEEEIPIEERMQEAQKEIRTMKVGRYGMTPVYGIDVEDGVYPVQVDSSSPYFRIIDAELIVKEHEMSARITISSLSYLYCYPGTGQEAAKDSGESYIGYEESDGHGVFTIPVKALNTKVPCAAFSRNRKKWYDRSLVFYASSLPEEALAVALPDYDVIETAIRAYDAGEAADRAENAETPHKIPEPVSVTWDDGEYSIEVNMTGGSGRASVSSPTLLIIRDGQAYARLLWSSTNYDYMILEDEYYYNQSEDNGNSTFVIPITALDEPIPVIADTTAMGDPVEIHYTLTFYEESIGPKGQIPQEAAKKVLIIAGIIIVAGWFLNYYVKKKRR